MIKLKYIFLILLIVWVLPSEAQCAMCRAVLESEDGGGAAKGINNGIVYLTNDRHEDGLVNFRSLRENISISAFKHLSKHLSKVLVSYGLQ